MNEADIEQLRVSMSYQSFLQSDEDPLNDATDLASQGDRLRSLLNESGISNSDRDGRGVFDTLLLRSAKPS